MRHTLAFTLFDFDPCSTWSAKAHPWCKCRSRRPKCSASKHVVDKQEVLEQHDHCDGTTCASYEDDQTLHAMRLATADRDPTCGSHPPNFWTKNDNFRYPFLETPELSMTKTFCTLLSWPHALKYAYRSFKRRTFFCFPRFWKLWLGRKSLLICLFLLISMLIRGVLRAWSRKASNNLLNIWPTRSKPTPTMTVW